MSEEFNNKPTLKERLKNLQINRSAVIAVCLLVAATVIICAVAIAGNRARKDSDELPETKKPTTQAPISNEPEETLPPADTDNQTTTKPSTTPTVTVDDKLPSFVLPVSGALYKKHDPTLQVFSNTMNDYRVHLGVDNSGGYGVDRDARRSELLGKRLGHTYERRLGCGIMNLAGCAYESPHRGNIDYSTLLSLEHIGNNGLRIKECARKVDGNHIIPLLKRDIRK